MSKHVFKSTPVTGDELVDLFINNGILHEVNRTFFHPLGLALTLRVAETTNENSLFISQTDDPKGFLFDVIDQFKRKAFLRLMSEKHRQRSDEVGFTLQINDLYRSDEIKKIEKTPEQQRLELILDALGDFVYNLRTSILHNHKEKDKDFEFPDRLTLANIMIEKIAKDDWISVACYAFFMHHHIHLKDGIKKLGRNK